ncbi:uncharacterized protein Z520_09591 [Fonsecaea multimorphosa CBS 102226]|uniref:Uncharacterized protein n=1 Tax=Fonsecaea multimorphosa CBS 102226 TaxID=1442371 RepID=A0A0D2GYA8_9EURO|nr:uncharacterized protein Z520_09591 [Fonsecaea multimorphosa CBS 102226]KIX94545.1 hypothetical protein Z520_09591 [Fonsecaea multimorphosa CBS 102226]OAL20257.1 hypothetical protein AYO22_08969 [Fonsecaea multimorphosa]
MFFTQILRFSILIIGLVSSALAVVVPRAVEACPENKFQDGANRKCIPYVVGKSLAGIKFSLYTWTESETSTTPAADPKYLQPLAETAATALPVYVGYMKTKVSEVRVYLSGESGILRGETDFRERDPTVCGVQIVGAGSGPSSDIESVQQAFAHELYHCVQRTFELTWPQDSNAWWFEGSADYFGNVFYPATKPDHMETYCGRSPLFVQAPSNGYAGSLYFQYLSDTLTSDGAINDWVSSRLKGSSSYTLRGEQSIISSEPLITKAFPSFATHFLGGAILYNNGEEVANTPTKGCEQLITTMYEVPMKPGTYKHATYALPWQIYQKLEVTFQANRLNSFTYDAPSGSHTVLQYRKDDEKEWTTAQKGKTVSIDKSCEKQKYVFLATSTGDGAPSTEIPVTIHFTVKKPPTNRKMKRNVRRSKFFRTEPAKGNSSMTLVDENLEEDLHNQGGISKRQDGDPASCPTSKCPYGSWKFTAAVESDGIKESTPDGVTVSNIDTKGSGTFTLDQDTKEVTLQFDGFSASFDDTAVGSDDKDFTIHYDLAIDGGGTATAVFAADGQSFKLTKPTYTGTFASQTTYPDAEPLGPTGDFDVGFGPDVAVEFACDNVATDGDDNMSLNGLFDGTFVYDIYYEPDDDTTA